MWLVNLLGLALIILIIWWFWLYKPKTAANGAGTTILVADGVYQPALVQVPAGQPLALIFLRKDASPCAETLQFPELEITVTLPLEKEARVNLPALEAGEYAFHCQMQMYRGSLRVLAER